MPDENDKNRESENINSYLFRFHFVKMLKEKLQSVTDDEKETDPEEIKSIVYLLKKYGYTPPPPEEFEKDKFLDRFYLKNSLGIYRYKGKFGRCFALWKKRNDPRIKPFKQLAYVTMAMIVGLMLLVFDHVTYAGNFKEVYQVQRYAEDIIIWNISDTQTDDIQEKNNLVLQQIPEEYRGKVYLPIDIINESIGYQCYEMIEQGNELYISSFLEENQWISLYVKIGGTSLNLNYKLGNNDILQDDICIWNNSQIYYNEVTKVTNLIFEIDDNLYVAFGNIPKDELIQIVNRMEEYQ